MPETRKTLNARQKVLRALLENPDTGSDGLALFETQHTQMHRRQVYDADSATYADVLFADLDEATYRSIPSPDAFSIVCHIWHLARIEDMTMNTLVAGENQIFHSENWHSRLNALHIDPGNAWSDEIIRLVSDSMSFDELITYRDHVGSRTKEIVKSLSPARLSDKVAPDAINLLRNGHDITKDSEGLLTYWGNRTIAGLLLMPPTRHAFVHLNQCYEIKKKMQK